MSARTDSKIADSRARHGFIGGSDARIIMGGMKPPYSAFGAKSAARREPEDLSGNLIVQLGLVTEPLNRLWYERNAGQ